MVNLSAKWWSKL